MNAKLITVLAVLAIPLLIAGTAAAQSESIPSWIKTIATFWGAGTISDTEFTNAMSYLIEEGMIPNQPYETTLLELETLRYYAAVGLISEFELVGGDSSVFCQFTEEENHKALSESVGPVSKKFTQIFLYTACGDTLMTPSVTEDTQPSTMSEFDIEIIICRERSDNVEVKGFLTNTGTSPATYEITFILYDVYGDVIDFETGYEWDVKPGERRGVERTFFDTYTFDSCEISAYER